MVRLKCHSNISWDNMRSLYLTQFNAINKLMVIIVIFIIINGLDVCQEYKLN